LINATIEFDLSIIPAPGYSGAKLEIIVADLIESEKLKSGTNILEL
jgi:hypothetical protein